MEEFGQAVRFEDPNKHAGASVIKDIDGGFEVSGYQRWKWIDMAPRSLKPVDHKTVAKSAMVEKHLNLYSKSVLDLGSNNGYMMALAYCKGASKITGVDIDVSYNNVAKQALDKIGCDRYTIHNTNVEDFHEPHDIVIAFALVHWLYSCTSLYGSLDAVIEHLSSITKEAAIIEFIDPQYDNAMSWFKHHEYNKDVQMEPYNKENFLKALNKHFKTVERVGETRKHREVWVTRQK